MDEKIRVLEERVVTKTPYTTIVYVELAGPSSATKPTAGIATGSIFTEVDTGKVFFFNETGATWVEQFSFQG